MGSSDSLHCSRKSQFQELAIKRVPVKCLFPSAPSFPWVVFSTSAEGLFLTERGILHWHHNPSGEKKLKGGASVKSHKLSGQDLRNWMKTMRQEDNWFSKWRILEKSTNSVSSKASVKSNLWPAWIVTLPHCVQQLQEERGSPKGRYPTQWEQIPAEPAKSQGEIAADLPNKKRYFQ